jgi:hypothetical protein
MERAQVFSVAVVANDRRSDDVVEALGLQILDESADRSYHDVRKGSTRDLRGESLVEDSSCELVLPTEDVDEMLGPQTAPRAELEDRLARKDVERVPHG